MCCGFLRGSGSGSQRLYDKLWLLPADGSPVDAHDEDRLEELQRVFTEAVYRSLQDGLGFDEKAARKEAEQGNPDAHEFQTPPRAFAVKKADDLVQVLNEADAHKNLLKMKTLPKALHHALKKLEYSINGPTRVGLQVPGYHKYTGLGLAERTAAYNGEDEGTINTDDGISLVLELRTFFIKDEPKQVDMASRLRAMMSIEKAYAEFVSWLDVQKRTWTIYKVFLNEVLPSGQGYGSSAVAEHLLAPPELFFPAQPGQGGDIENEKDRSWMGSLMDSIPDLEMIRICDIVNWNTYMLVSIAASKTRTCAEVFGEHMEWVLKQELQASRMSKEVLKSGTMLEVVLHTCLGKLIKGAVEGFNKKRGVKLEMVSAEAAASRGYENINGETRTRLNVEIKLQRVDSARPEAHGHSKRLKSQLKNLQDLDVTGAGNAEQVMEGLEALSMPEALKDFSNLSSPTARGQAKTEGPSSREPTAGDDGQQAKPQQQQQQQEQGDDKDLELEGVKMQWERKFSIPANDNMMLERLVAMLDNNPRGPQQDDPQQETRRRSSVSGMGAMPSDRLGRISSRRSRTEVVGGRPSKLSAGSLEMQPMSAVVGAMCQVYSELQAERTLSCLAVATASCPQESERPELGLDRNLQHQRQNTDEAFSNALGALKLATQCKLRGDAGIMCKDGAEVFQKVSVKAMLQRPVVEAACDEPPEKWMQRYLVVCCGDTGYHNLIAMIISWIVKAVKAIQKENKEAGPETQRHQILVILREHLGQHRALLSCKGSSRLKEENIGTQTWDTLNKGTRHLKELLGSASSHTSDLQKSLTGLLEDLAAMQDNVRREAREKDYSVPRSQILELFNRLTLLIDEAGTLISDELEGIIEATPVSFCFPVPAYIAEMNNGIPAQSEPGNCYSNEVFQLVDDLREGRFERVVVLAGAGISVSANLPDFRSPGGLYDQMRKQGISTPESVFTTDFMMECPDIFYKVMKQLRTEDVDPTPTHCFLRILQDRGLLQRCCTQNIDCLERKVGIKPENLVEAHGTLGVIRCMKCKKEHEKHCLYEPKESDGIPRCTACKSQLRPNIVFFGEELNWNAQSVQADLGAADLVIIMGTSLVVHPFAGIVNNVKPSCAILVVNRFMPKSLASQRRRRALTSTLLGKPPLRKEAFMQGNSDESIRWLANELGWGDELEEMVSQQPWRSSSNNVGGQPSRRSSRGTFTV